MYFKRLELSGFKSFARRTVLEFPTPITAIVGPNGSGKSNIREAVQWVLGEQAMKTLRGRKGEDLIWNGTPATPRVGKAAVALTFDNAAGAIPLEFPEITVGRKIFRDGMNEYTLNDTPVRLKDVVRLGAGLGIGTANHHIIGQGEVDRILTATPRERRVMIEESLGLRVHRLNKEDAERKLARTSENMREVAVSLREIAPHLKFLCAQARKAEAREGVERDFQHCRRAFLVREAAALAEEEQRVQTMGVPAAAERAATLQKIGEIRTLIAETERGISAGEDTTTGSRTAAHEARRQELLRELGRLEARIEFERANAARTSVLPMDTSYASGEIRKLLALCDTAGDTALTPSVLLAQVRERLSAFLTAIESGVEPRERSDHNTKILAELVVAQSQVSEELAALERTKATAEAAQQHMVEEFRKGRRRLQELDQELQAFRETERSIALTLAQVRFDRDRLQNRRSEFEAACRDAGFKSDALTSDGIETLSSESSAALKIRMDRLRLRLDEIGAIDAAVIVEYRETETRSEHLTRELTDLEEGARSLRSLIRELDHRVLRDFKSGFSNINDAFHRYFRMIFGGGRAALTLVTPLAREDSASNDAVGAPEKEKEYAERENDEGVDIAVDLPGKRVRGLQMLSGGERALASIALLFAIASVKPPPFLVLDETDAALDEANSRRYAGMIRELARGTQLLLITHNRETMKIAGVLYGVTMGSDGASKLLSLKLEDAEVYGNR